MLVSLRLVYGGISLTRKERTTTLFYHKETNIVELYILHFMIFVIDKQANLSKFLDKLVYKRVYILFNFVSKNGFLYI